MGADHADEVNDATVEVPHPPNLPDLTGQGDEWADEHSEVMGATVADDSGYDRREAGDPAAHVDGHAYSRAVEEPEKEVFLPNGERLIRANSPDPAADALAERSTACPG